MPRLDGTPTRHERRIERMRTQRIPNASRTTYRVSGTPHASRPGLSRPDATIYILPAQPGERTASS